MMMYVAFTPAPYTTHSIIICLNRLETLVSVSTCIEPFWLHPQPWITHTSLWFLTYVWSDIFSQWRAENCTYASGCVHTSSLSSCLSHTCTPCTHKNTHTHTHAHTYTHTIVKYHNPGSFCTNVDTMLIFTGQIGTEFLCSFSNVVIDYCNVHLHDWISTRRESQDSWNSCEISWICRGRGVCQREGGREVRWIVNEWNEETVERKEMRWNGREKEVMWRQRKLNCICAYLQQCHQRYWYSQWQGFHFLLSCAQTISQFHCPQSQCSLLCQIQSPQLWREEAWYT